MFGSALHRTREEASGAISFNAVPIRSGCVSAGPSGPGVGAGGGVREEATPPLSPGAPVPGGRRRTVRLDLKGRSDPAEWENQFSP